MGDSDTQKFKCIDNLNPLTTRQDQAESIVKDQYVLFYTSKKNMHKVQIQQNCLE